MGMSKPPGRSISRRDLLCTGRAQCAWSQTSANIRLILPFPPGGPADVMARVVAEQIGATGGPTFVIESTSGEPARKSAPNTLPAQRRMATHSELSQTRSSVLPLIRKLKYDPLTDLVPICELAAFPPLIVVNSGLAVPYARRSHQRRARSAGRADARHHWTGNLVANGVRNAQTCRQGEYHFRSVYRLSPAIQALLGNQMHRGSGRSFEPCRDNCRVANYARSPRRRGSGSHRCRTCQPSPNWGTTSRRSSSAVWSLPRIRRKRP